MDAGLLRKLPIFCHKPNTILSATQLAISYEEIIEGTNSHCNRSDDFLHDNGDPHNREKAGTSESKYGSSTKAPPEQQCNKFSNRTSPKAITPALRTRRPPPPRSTKEVPHLRDGAVEPMQTAQSISMTKTPTTCTPAAECNTDSATVATGIST